MQKNWLIRTKSNHILGPVSKEKVLELYHNGSIRPDDEICSGNGYWFFLREKEQVEAYLLGGQKQSFNPISEARDVLTATSPAPAELVEANADITLVGGIDLSQLKDTPAAAPAAKPAPRATVMAEAPKKKIELKEEAVELAAPEMAAAIPIRQTARVAVAPSPTPVAPGKPKRKEVEPVSKSVLTPTPKQRKVSDKIIMLSTVVILAVLAGVLYFRKRLIHEFIQSSVSIIMPVAHAQESAEDEGKKKVSFVP